MVPGMEHISLTITLRAEMEAAAARLGIEPSTLGERAGQGGRFYARLKDGKRVWPETAAKVRDYIARLEAGAQ
jgi:hypothetical protein